MSGTTLIRPICPSCGKKLGLYEESYINLLKTDATDPKTGELIIDEETGEPRKMTPFEAMNFLGITNYCCRTRVLSPILFASGRSLDDPSLTEELNILNVKTNLQVDVAGSLFMIQNKGGQSAVRSIIPDFATTRVLGGCQDKIEPVSLEANKVSTVSVLTVSDIASSEKDFAKRDNITITGERIGLEIKTCISQTTV